MAVLEVGHGESMQDGHVSCKSVPYTIIAQVRQGRYEVESQGARTSAGPGEAFVSGAHAPLRITHHGDPARGGIMKARWVHFHVVLFETIDFTSLMNLPPKLDAQQARPIARLIQELLRMKEAGGVRSLASIARKQELGYRALRVLSQASNPRESALIMLQDIHRLLPVLRYLKEQPSRPVAIADLAKRAHLSRSRFHGFFKERLGCSPMRYAKNLRLDRARHELITTGKSMRELGEELGFSNQFHFSREFKAKFGVSPTEYRRTQRGLVV